MPYGASSGKSAATGYTDFYKNSGKTSSNDSNGISDTTTDTNSDDSLVVKQRKAAIRRRLMATKGS